MVALVVGVVVAAGAAIGATAWARSTGTTVEPVVQLRQRVPVEVEHEVRATVADFVAVFGARRDCIGGAELELVRTLDEGDARYLPTEQLIQVAIPTSPRRFRESLVHELAHHVEHSCPDAELLRHHVMRVVGATEWTAQDRWEERPSELWAESVVEIVLGERIRFGRSVPLGERLLEVARRWISHPST